MRFTFPKIERLCSKSKIDQLFLKGKTLNAKPFKLIYSIDPALEGQAPVQILISVPKRRIKKAVDRNAIKRAIREIYRLNKNFLLEKAASHNKNLHIALVYYGGKDLTYAFADKKIKNLLIEMAGLLQ